MVSRSENDLCSEEDQRVRSLMIKMRFDATDPSSRRDLNHLARQVGRVDGLIDVCWFESGRTISLLVSFEDAEASTRFLDSPIMADVTALAGCRDVYVEDLPASNSLTATSFNAMAQRLQTSGIQRNPEPVAVAARG